jgi:hypothetical protein
MPLKNVPIPPAQVKPAWENRAARALPKGAIVGPGLAKRRNGRGRPVKRYIAKGPTQRFAESGNACECCACDRSAADGRQPTIIET